MRIAKASFNLFLINYKVNKPYITFNPYISFHLFLVNTMYNHGVPVYGILELIDKYDLIAD